MSDIKVTQTEIDLLLNSADVQVRTEFGKCTVVTVRLRNGFILTESSACVDPANYDVELGKKLCFQHIENRLWELEGYALQKKTDEERAAKCKAVEAKTHDFGWGEERLKKLSDCYDQTFMTYAEMCLADAKTDKQIWFTQGKVDERLKKARGKYFVPWDERYK